MVKDALRKLWNDTCNVYIQEKTINEINKRTEFVETLVIENEPCKLSFNSLNTVENINNAPSITQTITIFLDNELEIPSGSKIVVTRQNKQFVYKQSGQPRLFSNHQEIKLELFERWA